MGGFDAPLAILILEGIEGAALDAPMNILGGDASAEDLGGFFDGDSGILVGHVEGVAYFDARLECGGRSR